MKREKNMRSRWRESYGLLIVVLLVLLSVQPGFAQSSEPSTEADRGTFGGPDQVQNRIEADRVEEDTLYEFEFMKPYYEWKDRIQEKYGYAYALDYYPIYLKASDNLPGTDDDAASAVLRFSGFWQLYGRGGDSNSTGTLVYLVEHRHRYTDNLPGEFALESLGYAGFIGIPFTDDGWHLTNLYWNQEWQNGFGFAAGFLDVTDWVDVYALTSPWSDFYNFVFSIGAATMDLPDDAALGLGVGGWVTDGVYIIGGFEDLNADPTDPFEGFNTFWNDHEFFKHIEVGWSTSAREQYYLDNLHLTVWHADKRDEIGVEDGWGAFLSFSHTVDEKWLLFARGGFAEDGGSLLEKSVSVGGGYAPNGIGAPGSGHQLGFGANWGQPNDALFGSDLDDQYALEVYYRLQITKEIAITPDVQLLINPALNPEEDTIWVFGFRGRLGF
ncbi:MAG: carbohydrate porin [Syntrophobacterales bacterium]|jgi:porin